MARVNSRFQDLFPDTVPPDDAPPSRAADLPAAPAPPIAPVMQAGNDATRGQRSAPNPREQSLSSLAHAWWRRLPSAHQPHELCILYPRIANRIALCWGDAELTERLFASLLVDDVRGNRKGFPKDVLNELLALRELLRPTGT